MQAIVGMPRPNPYVVFKGGREIRTVRVSRAKTYGQPNERCLIVMSIVVMAVSKLVASERGAQ